MLIDSTISPPKAITSGVPGVIAELRLEDLPLFAGLTAAELDEIRPLMKLQRHPARYPLFDINDKDNSIYIVLTGTVKVFVQRGNGSCIVLNILGPGEIIGEISAIDGLNHSASAMVVEASLVAQMRRDDFMACMERYPQMGFNLARILVGRLRRLTEHAEALATLDVGGRLARQLVVFAKQYGRRNDDDDLALGIQVTQIDLAQLTGTTREQVNRFLRLFKSMELISVQGHEIIISNLTGLEQRYRL